MFIPRIYYPASLTVADVITPDKTLYHQLIDVLRLRNEEKIILFNGQGGEFSATLNHSKKHAHIHIDEFIPCDRESPLSLHLGQGLARGDKMDWIIQKATELGIKEITPLFTEKSQVKLDEKRSQSRLTHWQHIAISACEQCGRTQLPRIYPPTHFVDWIKSSFTGVSLFFDRTATGFVSQLPLTHSFRLAIGPESGWSKLEITHLLERQFISCQLGPRILRTETAGVVAISLLQGLYGDLGKNPYVNA